jgi:hypothetical protein
MQVKLIVVEGHARERELVRELPIVIGRSRAAGVTVGDPKVSRQHCFLEEHGGMVMLRDNGSLNGTLLDGQRVEGEAVIRPGAKLTVGPLTFVVIYEPTGEGVQADTGQMPQTPAGAPDFEALMAGAGDDAEEDEGAVGDAAAGDGAPGDIADVTRASPAVDEATLQWLPPPAAASESPAFLPPPASKQAAKAEPQRPALPTEFDWLANSGGDGDTAEPASEVADETACAAQEEAAQRDPVDADSPAKSSDEKGDEADDGERSQETAQRPEALEPASSPGSAANKPPGKSRSWWPFGKKRQPSAASGAEPAAKPGSAKSAPHVAEAPDQEDEPSAVTPANEQVVADDTVGPASETLAVSDPSVPSPQQVPAEEGGQQDEGREQDDDEGDFNQFLKGLH